jgi:hypothetical protein
MHNCRGEELRHTGGIALLFNPIIQIVSTVQQANLMPAMTQCWGAAMCPAER